MTDAQLDQLIRSEMARLPDMSISVAPVACSELQRNGVSEIVANVPVSFDPKSHAGRADIRYIVMFNNELPIARRVKTILHEFGHLHYFYRTAHKDHDQVANELSARVYACERMLELRLVDSIREQVADTEWVINRPNEYPPLIVQADQLLIKSPIWPKLKEMIQRS